MSDRKQDNLSRNCGRTPGTGKSAAMMLPLATISELPESEEKGPTQTADEASSPLPIGSALHCASDTADCQTDRHPADQVNKTFEETIQEFRSQETGESFKARVARSLTLLRDYDAVSSQQRQKKNQETLIEGVRKEPPATEALRYVNKSLSDKDLALAITAIQIIFEILVAEFDRNEPYQPPPESLVAGAESSSASQNWATGTTTPRHRRENYTTDAAFLNLKSVLEPFEQTSATERSPSAASDTHTSHSLTPGSSRRKPTSRGSVAARVRQIFNRESRDAEWDFRCRGIGPSPLTTPQPSPINTVGPHQGREEYTGSPLIRVASSPVADASLASDQTAAKIAEEVRSPGEGDSGRKAGPRFGFLPPATAWGTREHAPQGYVGAIQPSPEGGSGSGSGDVWEDGSAGSSATSRIPQSHTGVDPSSASLTRSGGAGAFGDGEVAEGDEGDVLGLLTQDGDQQKALVRVAFGLPPAPVESSSSLQQAHTNHDNEFHYRNVWCVFCDPTSCDRCGAACCVRTALAMNVNAGVGSSSIREDASRSTEAQAILPRLQAPPGSEFAGQYGVRAQLDLIERVFGRAVDPCSTFMRCTSCSRTVCPGCAFRCRVSLCGCVVCSDCGVAEWSDRQCEQVEDNPPVDGWMCSWHSPEDASIA